MTQPTILVVDDDRHSRQGLQMALAGAGYGVETAANSWEAIKKIRERSFEIAIIDLDLPPVHGANVTGWDLVGICRAQTPPAIIIVVTVENDTALRAWAERFRVAEILEKPVSPIYVTALVGKLTSRSR
jgi:DNA-binding NtrC family response regulator